MSSYHSILQKIGNTPIIKLRNLKVKPKVEIWLKLENQNPGGSVKDRPALFMIEEAEKQGLLCSEKIVIEASSGNTGIGLSLVCAVKKYKCIIAMPESASIERRKIMQAFGAEILLTPAEKGTDGAIELVYEIVRENPNKYFCPDQFNNPANWLSHYKTTGPEIWRDTEGRVNYVVCGLGTTGTAMGIAKFAKENNLPLKVIGVEPQVGHKIQGLKNMKESYPPGIFDKKLLYQIVNVEDEEAFYWSRWLAKNEGILVGMSSGAALAGALKFAEKLEEGFIVVISPDGGERYLSTPLWSFVQPEKETDLILFNTLTEKREPFWPLELKKVKIYTCGPTLYSRPHIGFYRRLITVDLLKAYLKLKGYEVYHVVNLTDFDDRVIKVALENNLDIKEISSQVEREFWEDLKHLEIEPADLYPKVSEHLEEMKTLALRLWQKNQAYEKFSSLYFDLSRFKDYGKLSKIDLKTLKPGVTIDLEDYGKEEPFDFALLKRVHILELKQGYFIDTNFGKVRPTWHIHCAALALKYLGETFDLYTSSSDLIFPHHENTRAVAKAITGKELANYWIHTALVYIEGKKLSSENKITLEDILKEGYSGKVLRLYFLRTHYRNPFNFSWKGLKETQKLLEKIERYLAFLVISEEKKLSEEEEKSIRKTLERFQNNWQKAIKEDLNTPLALSELISFFKKIYPYFQKGLPLGMKKEILKVFQEFNQVFKVFTLPEEVKEEKVLEKIKMREKAKREKNYLLADKIREELSQEGYIVLDTSLGTKVLKR